MKRLLFILLALAGCKSEDEWASVAKRWAERMHYTEITAVCAAAGSRGYCTVSCGEVMQPIPLLCGDSGCWIDYSP